MHHGTPEPGRETTGRPKTPAGNACHTDLAYANNCTEKERREGVDEEEGEGSMRERGMADLRFWRSS